MRSTTKWTAQAVMLFASCWVATPLLADSEQEGWTRFRGPNGRGVIDQSSVSIPWSERQVMARLDLPAPGNGSPVIWHSRAFLLCGDRSNADRFLVAVDLEKPRILWQQKYASEVHPLHKLSSYASSTPCVDADHVYCAWGAPTNVTVKAFTHDGKEVWSRELGRYVTQHGFGTSPILVDNKVILFDSQDAQELPAGVAPGQDTMIALDRLTGDTVWETPLATTRVCYGAPCVTQIDGKTAILCSSTGEGFFALDAQNGKPLWGMKTSIFSKRVCSSIQLVDSLLISTEGSGGGGNVLFAVKADSSREPVYTIKRSAPYVPTPVAKDGLMFLWEDKGIVSCVDSKSGNVHWTERIGGNVSSSPIIIGDKLLGVSQEGMVTVLAASKTFQKLGEIDLGQTTRSTPAVTQDRLLIRTDDQLWVIAP